MSGTGHEGDDMTKRTSIAEALRQVLAPPHGGDEYWAGLEARIMERVAVARAAAVQDWRMELAAWARPGLAAAAALLLFAGALMLHGRREEQRRAYESLLAATPVPVEAAVRPSLQTEQDATLRFLLQP
jgi:hypothetical protein